MLSLKIRIEKYRNRSLNFINFVENNCVMTIQNVTENNNLFCLLAFSTLSECYG